MTSPHTPQLECSAFDARLEDYLEAVLDDGQRAAMDAHRSSCARCAALVAELDSIVAEAGALPAMTPSRDLWPEIETRINTPGVSRNRPTSRAITPRTFSVRAFAAAAVLLVTVSSGATWMLMRGPSVSTAVPSVGVASPGTKGQTSTPMPTTAVAVVPDTVLVSSTRAATPASGMAPSSATTSSGTSRARLASRGNDEVGLIYEREIRSMRHILDERLGDLDSATVVEVERNLRIIDRAIEDSRRALERDPRSRFLSTQLDRALENKLAIMRRVALL